VNSPLVYRVTLDNIQTDVYDLRELLTLVEIEAPFVRRVSIRRVRLGGEP
jgi:hypothetical protein